jgi:pimeloyl-ACP methyl ester carboxylesterase
VITKDRDGWDLRESGPADADHTVLLLPGGLCTAVFFDDLMAEPKLSEAPIRLVAATPPGYGGTPPPEDLTMENYARLAGKLAAGLGCEIVVGHSLGGNVALEMVAAGEFSGSVILLSPSFSREDEFKELGMLNRIGRVPGVGYLAYAAPSLRIRREGLGRLRRPRRDRADRRGAAGPRRLPERHDGHCPRRLAHGDDRPARADRGPGLRGGLWHRGALKIRSGDPQPTRRLWICRALRSRRLSRIPRCVSRVGVIPRRPRRSTSCSMRATSCWPCASTTPSADPTTPHP